MQNTNPAPNVRETLFNLPAIEKIERRKALRHYLFYKGKCPFPNINEIQDDVLLGQSWKSNDNVDYTPTQDIRNKVKPLLKKQARFMFGAEPTITFKPDDSADNDTCEELRKFIDDIFEGNQFWKNTKKAFLMSTIKKRVLLRVEANPGEPISIKYENIDDFYYDEKNGKLLKVVFFQEDDNNALIDDDTKKIYYLHTYFYNREKEDDPVTAFYKRDTYVGGDLSKPIETVKTNTGFDTIPCWLIKNGGELNDDFGESDLEDLMDSQTQYNKKNSDFADALRFEMFGSTVVVDGKADDVNKLSIAPNGLQAVRTDDKAAEKGRQATVQRQEYNMGSAEAANSYLDRLEKDMRDTLDMPDVSDLTNIPSAKAMKYLYNDLIARCEDKWTDWQPVFKQLINFIVQVAQYSYGNFNKSWVGLSYSIVFQHNYPLPEDDADKKTVAMEEVKTNVMSHKEYIKKYGDVEDADGEYKQILDEISQITAAENEQMIPDDGSNSDGDSNDLE